MAWSSKVFLFLLCLCVSAYPQACTSRGLTFVVCDFLFKKKPNQLTEDDDSFVLDRKGTTNTEKFRENSQTMRFEATRVRGALLSVMMSSKTRMIVILVSCASIDDPSVSRTETCRY